MRLLLVVEEEVGWVDGSSEWREDEEVDLCCALGCGPGVNLIDILYSSFLTREVINTPFVVNREKMSGITCKAKIVARDFPKIPIAVLLDLLYTVHSPKMSTTEQTYIMIK